MGQVREPEGRQAALADAEHLAWTAQPQVLLRNRETVLGPPQDRQPGARGGVQRRLVEQQAGGFPRAAADATAKLVQLGQSEPLGMLDNDDAGIGHVDPDLDYGGRDQQADGAAGECVERGSLGRRGEPAMDEADRSPNRSASRRWRSTAAMAVLSSPAS